MTCGRPDGVASPPALLAALGLSLVLGLPGCVQWGWKTPQDFLDVYALPAPGVDGAVLCHAYGCQMRREVTFMASEWNEIDALFEGVTNAGSERAALAQAVAKFERLAGYRLGTSQDPGGVLDAHFSGDPGHLDCVDEAVNTTSYLLLLEGRGLMTRHRTRPADIRGMFIDGHYQHYAAVIEETASGQEWVVDSWLYDNGEPPLIQTRSAWRSHAGAPPTGL